MSPCLTRRLCRTTRFMRALPSSRSSSAKTMRTVSFLFFPFTKTVSPRNNCRVSMVLFESAMIELSSLTASVTLQRGIVSRNLWCLGRFVKRRTLENLVSSSSSGLLWRCRLPEGTDSVSFSSLLQLRLALTSFFSDPDASLEPHQYYYHRR